MEISQNQKGAGELWCDLSHKVSYTEWDTKQIEIYSFDRTKAWHTRNL